MKIFNIGYFNEIDIIYVAYHNLKIFLLLFESGENRLSVSVGVDRLMMLNGN